MRKLELMDFLSVGEQNAIKVKELAECLKCNEREITITVNALRKKGELICSGASGLWLPADNKDIEDFIRMMKSRIADMELAMSPAVEHLKNGGVFNA